MHNNTNDEYAATNMSRDFKGIWIPREIWLHPSLLPLEKLLWAEVHSLFNRVKGGCYARNDYLARFFGVSERHIQGMISRLKALGFMVEVSFDGRQRVIKSVLPPEDFGSSEQTRTTVHPCDEPQFTPDLSPSSCPTYIEGIDKGISNIPPNPQGGRGRVSPSFSAKNAKKPKGSDVSDILKDTYHENVLLSKEEYEKLLALHGEKGLIWMIEVLSAYLGSSGKQYKSHYHVMAKGGWVCKRLEEETSKNPNLTPKGNYNRYGKLAIGADKRAQPSERQHFNASNVSDEEHAAYMAQLKALKAGKS